MTKIDLIEIVRDTFGYPRIECVELVEIFLGSIKESLAAGDDLKTSGFGTWQ